ncbi:hypothetical protein [Streptomyces sp. NPDC058086]|uniref:hypothetical protein n=1 Tax=Streptomyces sp. NPDC058086 TaxID=3346334 RepID=UPI0036E5DEA7
MRPGTEPSTESAGRTEATGTSRDFDPYTELERQRGAYHQNQERWERINATEPHPGFPEIPDRADARHEGYNPYLHHEDYNSYTHGPVDHWQEYESLKNGQRGPDGYLDLKEVNAADARRWDSHQRAFLATRRDNFSRYDTSPNLPPTMASVLKQHQQQMAEVAQAAKMKVAEDKALFNKFSAPSAASPIISPTPTYRASQTRSR